MNTNQSKLEDQFGLFAHKIRQAGLPDLLLHTFHKQYLQLAAGHEGYIPNTEAKPIDDLPTMEQLDAYAARGAEVLERTVMIKLNGGLGTTMGLDDPKSLLVAKDGHTFLDIIVRQVLQMRQKWNIRLPLILMNSFHTHEKTLSALATLPLLEQNVPLWFEQHQIPKIWQDNLAPVEWSIDPEKEWCPPGHGDLYLAIQSRGLLEQLLSRGYEYAFISNSDNLGAVVDINILGYFAACHLTFLMEVTRRTECDRKGGHLAKNADGHLILREVAQCPSEEMVQFQDIALYRFFNTNNLWLHLPSLRRILRERDGYLDLPLIRNVKSVDPRQANLPKVYQLETAMGAAIGLLPNVQALVVPRDRFLPVKNTNHLFALWSDAFVLDDDFRVVRNPKRLSSHEPLIDLDTHYFKSVDQLRSRWPNGVPSLLNCDRLSIQGNLFLSNDMNLAGDVCIQYLGDEPLYLAPYRISENNIQIKLNGELRTYPKSGCESDQLLEQDGVVTELFG